MVMNTPARSFGHVGHNDGRIDILHTQYQEQLNSCNFPSAFENTKMGVLATVPKWVLTVYHYGTPSDT